MCGGAYTNVYVHVGTCKRRRIPFSDPHSLQHGFCLDLAIRTCEVRSSRGAHAHFCIALGQGNSPVMQGATIDQSLFLSLNIKVTCNVYTHALTVFSNGFSCCPFVVHFLSKTVIELMKSG